MGIKRLGMTGCAIPSRAMLGLWHGQGIVSGFRATYSNKKIKRRWRPRLHTAYYHSDVLDRKFKITVSSMARRKIDKAGGFDRYILYTSPYAMNSLLGNAFKKAMQLKIASDPSIEVPQQFVFPPMRNRRQESIDLRKKLLTEGGSQQQEARRDLSLIQHMEREEVERVAKLAEAAMENVKKKGLLKNQLKAKDSSVEKELSDEQDEARVLGEEKEGAEQEGKDESAIGTERAAGDKDSRKNGATERPAELSFLSRVINLFGFGRQ